MNLLHKGKTLVVASLQISINLFLTSEFLRELVLKESDLLIERKDLLVS